MTQPKDPPLSIRLPAALLALLKDEAVRRKVTVNALVVRAIRKEIGQWSDEEVAAMKAKPRQSLKINRIEAPAPEFAKHDSRVRLNLPADYTAGPAVHVVAPVFQRKAFNPQPKAGKKPR